MIPILVVLTVVMIFQVLGGRSEQQDAAATPTDAPAASLLASTEITSATSTGDSYSAKPLAPPPTLDEKPGSFVGSAKPATTAPGVLPDLTIQDAKGHPAAAIAAGALPAGKAFGKAGSGVWRVVPGTTPVRGTGSQRFSYTVEVENGIQDVKADNAFAAAVDATLADPRSWIGGKKVALRRIDKGDPDFRISLTSQQTVRAGCGFDIPLEASCFNAAAARVFINDARWVRGAMSYNADLDSYRAYAINHEVGHALGMAHQPCPAAGAPAPVMMQQSWSVSNNDLSVLDPQAIPKDGKVCKPNPYPFPGARGASNPPTDPTNAAG